MGVGARHECEEGRTARVSSPSPLSSYVSSLLATAVSAISLVPFLSDDLVHRKLENFLRTVYICRLCIIRCPFHDSLMFREKNELFSPSKLMKLIFIYVSNSIMN